MSTSSSYFARTLHGLEDISWRDISAHTDSKLIQLSHRSIEFSSTGDASDLLRLRGIEDVFVLVGKISNLTHERSALGLIEEQIRKLSLSAAIETCKQVREITRPFAYSVTASFVGSRNYNRWELAEAVAKGLSKRHDWSYIDTRATPFPAHDINIRLVIEADRALLGIRLGSAPLHKRPYKQLHVEASLNPILAYHMVRMSRLRAGECLLDPMCGAGTIPIEAAFAEPEAIVLAIDIDAEAIQAAKENASLANASVAIQQGSAINSNLESGSIDAIVCDLPWGGQSELEGGSLNQMCAEFIRLLKPSGRMVLLTEHPDDVRKAFEAAAFTVECPLTVSLHGKHPSILLTHKT